MPRSSISELLWNKVNVSKPSETARNPRGFDKWPPDGTRREGGRDARRMVMLLSARH